MSWKQELQDIDGSSPKATDSEEPNEGELSMQDDRRLRMPGREWCVESLVDTSTIS